MLIPKNKKKELVHNPFRPKIGIPPKHTICKLSWAEYYIEPEESEMRIRVDAAHNEEFIAALEATVPKKERYRCHDHEVWLIDKKWKKDLLKLAEEYYDEVIKELRQW
jgi:hypothetical protein